MYGPEHLLNTRMRDWCVRFEEAVEEGTSTGEAWGVRVAVYGLLLSGRVGVRPLSSASSETREISKLSLKYTIRVTITRTSRIFLRKDYSAYIRSIFPAENIIKAI